MKRFSIIILISFLFSQPNIQLPMKIRGVRYNASISKPEEIIGHQIGSRHTRTDQVIDYFEAMASRSNRIILEDHAKTHEGRRLIHAIVTHPDNHENLEAIRLANLTLSNNPNGVTDKDLNTMSTYLGKASLKIKHTYRGKEHFFKVGLQEITKEEACR